MGTLSTAACAGGGVTVSFTEVDWLGANDGCIATVTPTNITYAGGTLSEGVTGTIKDLTLGGGPVVAFMTFTGHPDLQFDLDTIGPGVANTVCPDTFNAADPVCSAFAGSPFVLRPGGAGTTVTLSAFGTASDGSGVLSNWQGTFSVDFAGETPADLVARFQQQGSITSGHSGSFIATPIPEPASFVLMGAGLLAVGLLGRRARKQ
jgi:hypothetical protein